MSLQPLFVGTIITAGFGNQNLRKSFFEEDNPFDPFAIKVCEIGKTASVGHLPREISRATKFFVDRGGRLSVTLTSEHYRRSPLVQGGMEIGCKVTASIPGTCINILILKKYQDIIEENYTEPKEEAILGSYLVPNDASEVDQEARVPSTATTSNTNKKRDKVKSSAPKSKDIRLSFTQQRRVEKQKESDSGRVKKLSSSTLISILFVSFCIVNCYVHGILNLFRFRTPWLCLLLKKI